MEVPNREANAEDSPPVPPSAAALQIPLAIGERVGVEPRYTYLTDTLSRFAEAAVRAGIVVVAAVGNNGHRPGYVVPPASVPAVISVGGIDDHGDPRRGPAHGYRSSFGPTIDGLQKPEVVTLAEAIAARILPGTPTAREAALLAQLHAAPDGALAEIIEQHPGVFAPLDEAKDRPPYLLRQLVQGALRDGAVIDEHYKKVDGTSFAAPIVTSVVAQMLQANPGLTPGHVKRILLETAERVPGIAVEQQGWGAVRPRLAVQRALDARPG